MAYTGLRKPRTDDLENWKTYFSVNPEKKDDFPEMFVKCFNRDEPKNDKKVRKVKKAKTKKEKKAIEEVEAIVVKKEVPEVKVKDDKQEIFINSGDTFWADTLQKQITIWDMDPESGLVAFRISGYDILPLDELINLGLRKFNENYIDHNKEKLSYSDGSRKRVSKKGTKITIQGKATLNKVHWSKMVDDLTKKAKI